MKIREILDKLDIEYYERSGDNEYIYYGKIKYGNSILPIVIIEDIDCNLLFFKSFAIPANGKRKGEIFKLLNYTNSQSIYGTVYLDEENDILYDIVIVGEKNREYKFETIQEYVDYFTHKVVELIEQLDDKRLLELDEE